MDGKRTVSDIRDVLTGRYEPVPLREVAEYLELLGRARVITVALAAGPGLGLDLTSG